MYQQYGTKGNSVLFWSTVVSGGEQWSRDLHRGRGQVAPAGRQADGCVRRGNVRHSTADIRHVECGTRRPWCGRTRTDAQKHPGKAKAMHTSKRRHSDIRTLRQQKLSDKLLKTMSRRITLLSLYVNESTHSLPCIKALYYL
jgi:hypothetical protein